MPLPGGFGPHQHKDRQGHEEAAQDLAFGQPFMQEPCCQNCGDGWLERFGRSDMEEVFLDMARGRGRGQGLDALRKGEAAS